MSNITVCKFQYKLRKYEVDMLTETKWGSEMCLFDIFDITDVFSKCIGQMETNIGADYKKWAKEVIDDAILGISDGGKE